ncbi:MAG TPA: Xaa-Pro peptidase family protein [Methanothrix sp.]|nr:Xaa-Pro peptidase family protein [Methanothrix sp.]
MKESNYILTPRGEIEGRIKRLQENMGDLTGVIILGSINLGYFSGTTQEGLIYIPRDGLPRLMIKKSLERAAEEAAMSPQPQKSLRSLRKDLGISSGARIGLELDILPYSYCLRLAGSLGEDLAISDISETIKHIRSVKSEYEIGLIRRAAENLDAAIAGIADHLREGMREIDLAAEVEKSLRLSGHPGRVAFRRFNHSLPMGHLMAGESAAYPSYVSSPTGGKGMSLFLPQGPGFARIRRGQTVLVDYAGCYNGYIADETRIFCLGRPSPEMERAHQAALQIEEATVRELLPGRVSREIWDIEEAEGKRLGYSEHLGGPPGKKAGFVGHGVGLEIDEYPVIGPLNQEIEENMVIAIEPKMIYPGEGVVGVEDTYLVRPGGSECLTRLPKEIWRI